MNILAKRKDPDQIVLMQSLFWNKLHSSRSGAFFNGTKKHVSG